MGTSNNGNFDNDSARDYIYSLQKEITDEIEGYLTYEEDPFCIDDIDTVMAAVEVIISLCKDCLAIPPEIEIVNRWRDTILKVYDNEIDELEPDKEYKVGRRKIIEGTFQRLEKETLKKVNL
jgi:hypothetical protein